jgi:hypothetical protein
MIINVSSARKGGRSRVVTSVFGPITANANHFIEILMANIDVSVVANSDHANSVIN